MIHAAGYEPEGVEYPKTGWIRPLLELRVGATGGTVHDILREEGAPAEEPELLEPAGRDDVLLEAMAAHPILVDRPIVEAPLGVRLRRRSERVLDLPERRPAGEFSGEDGEVAKPRRRRLRGARRSWRCPGRRRCTW